MSNKVPSCEAAKHSETVSLVSIVIPVYNVSSYLAECLWSVIHQSYHNIEIIIIDDGSTDGSGSICDRFAQYDDRICVIHTDNRGLSCARNLGLEKCRGSYLMFVDSDDWIEYHSVETLMKYAKKYNADIVSARRCREYVGKTICRAKKDEDARIARGNEILAFYGKGLLPDVVWNKLYLSECFFGIRFYDGHNYEDVSVTWKIMTHLAKTNGTAVVLPDSLYHFRIRKSSISHTESCRNIVDGWMAYHEKYEGVPEYRKQFLPGCFWQIGYMWKNYYGFSGKEKAVAAHTVLEMRSFSTKHFCQVMKGTNPISIKVICLVSQSRSPLIMWFCFWGGKLLRIIRNIRRRTLYN